MTEKDLETVYVDSYKDIPDGVPEGTHASFHLPTGTIYAIKGIATPSDIEHERFHATHHKQEEWLSAEDMVKQELEADLYAYERTGEPRDYTDRFGFMWTELRELYDLSPLEAMRLLKRALVAINAPDSWWTSYNQGLKQFGGVHKARYGAKTLRGLSR